MHFLRPGCKAKRVPVFLQQTIKTGVESTGVLQVVSTCGGLNGRRLPLKPRDFSGLGHSLRAISRQRGGNVRLTLLNGQALCQGAATRELRRSRYRSRGGGARSCTKRMPAVGQTEKSGRATGKSVSSSITDFVRGHRHVSKVSTADSCTAANNGSIRSLRRPE